MKEIISYGRFRCNELTPHKNRGMEITLVEKGLLEWMVEGVPEKVVPGSVFFTLPWQVHGSLHPKEPDNMICHVLFHLEQDYPVPCKQFRFPASFGFTPAENRTLSILFTGSSQHAFRATPAMRWLMPAVITEQQTGHLLGKAHTISLLRAVLIELGRTISGEAADTGTHSWTSNKVQRLITELAGECDQPWTLKQMAERCGIRRTQLNNIFQKLTGSTPMDYLVRLRIERAKALLRETNIKIIDIAFECGFSSSQYFANTFCHATGMTPSKYRLRCAGLTPAELKKWAAMEFRSEQEERRRVQQFTAEKVQPREL
ncbi:MAG: helix-turn-helix transcriptional regulator [Kiritimatiellales bacterium]